MRQLMVLNAKGGSGKTTIATNLASYYATQGLDVVLADLDEQGSALAWLAARPAGRPPIRGVDASAKGARLPRSADVAILDAPAGVHKSELGHLMRRADTFLVPVLPSPIDMRAAEDFIAEMRRNKRIQSQKAKYGVIANRAKEHTNVFRALEQCLRHLRVPVLTQLRDSMNYVRAAERGIGIHELAPYRTAFDRAQWRPISKWLNSKRSRPSP
ncbi:MAG: chromosome partitioning protein [Proteobacteria bacterium SW_6_67_9]|nr:MAG: chromosome partitioning protein [Proteobacteria bacterium SW_6_67_9]